VAGGTARFVERGVEGRVGGVALGRLGVGLDDEAALGGVDPALSARREVILTDLDEEDPGGDEEHGGHPEEPPAGPVGGCQHERCDGRTDDQPEAQPRRRRPLRHHHRARHEQRRDHDGDRRGAQRGAPSGTVLPGYGGAGQRAEGDHQGGDGRQGDRPVPVQADEAGGDRERYDDGARQQYQLWSSFVISQPSLCIRHGPRC
jgi:hypothetical protein